MARARVPETDQGIQGQLSVEIYDQMQRRLRDKGWIETQDVIKAGMVASIFVSGITTIKFLALF